MKSSVAHLRLLVVVFFVTILSTLIQPTTYAQDQAVTGNLDVYGDTFNFGSWATDSTKLGLGITYSEDTNHASTLTLTTTRPVSGWLWQRATNSGTTNLPQMSLSSGNALTLYDQVSPTPNATIVLDPLGTNYLGTSTTFNGMDNEMPNQTVMGSGSILTVGLADARYLVQNNGNKLSIGAGSSAMGDQSMALGYQANASGSDSVVLGNNSSATGFATTALGTAVSATGSYSTALGYYSGSAGTGSTVVGVGSYATGSNSVALGANAQALGVNSTSLGVYAQADSDYSTALGHQTYATGYASTALGENTQANNTYTTALGHYTFANGYMSSALATSALANGYESTALGYGSGASGSAASALGLNSSATGDYSTALGSFSSASGAYSTALTSSAVASGDYSVSASRGAATSVYQMAVGAYGLPGGDAHNWIPTDALFTVGNGQSAAAPSNALLVKKNGDTTVGGKLNVTSDLNVSGVIIVQPQGDLSMGEFIATPSPSPTP